MRTFILLTFRQFCPKSVKVFKHPSASLLRRSSSKIHHGGPISDGNGGTCDDGGGAGDAGADVSNDTSTSYVPFVPEIKPVVDDSSAAVNRFDSTLRSCDSLGPHRYIGAASIPMLPLTSGDEQLTEASDQSLLPSQGDRRSPFLQLDLSRWW